MKIINFLLKFYNYFYRVFTWPGAFITYFQLFGLFGILNRFDGSLWLIWLKFLDCKSILLTKLSRLIINTRGKITSVSYKKFGMSEYRTKDLADVVLRNNSIWINRFSNLISLFLKFNVMLNSVLNGVLLKFLILVAYFLNWYVFSSFHMSYNL